MNMGNIFAMDYIYKTKLFNKRQLL